MKTTNALSVSELVLRLGADVRPGEGRKVFTLCYMLFMLMFTAYVLKPVREELILVEGGSQFKSYATAIQAAFLLLLVPVYSYWSRRLGSRSFMLAIAGMCALVFAVFVLCGLLGIPIALAFYIWYGTYGLLMASQFWAYCSDYYSEQEGKRLFGLIAFGAAAGAMTGAIVSKMLSNELDAFILLAAGALMIVLAVLPVWYMPVAEARAGKPEKTANKQGVFNAFRLVFSSRFLFSMAVFALLFNWLNSLGEYLVSVIVEHCYTVGLEEGRMAVSKNAYIRGFYSNYYLVINVLGTLLQFFVVSRLINFLGVRVALLLVPVITLLGYSLIVFVPVLMLFKMIKVLENSLDYSLLGTTRQILYLPASRQARYEARAAIETICVRMGDVLQGLTVFVVVSLLALKPKSLLWLIIAASIVLVLVAIYLGKAYQKMKQEAEHAGDSAE